MMKVLVLSVAIAVLALSLGFAKMFTKIFDWRLWRTIRRAKCEVRQIARQRIPSADAFTRQGATAINPRYISFWITTATDKERDLLRQDEAIYRKFRDALERVGYPRDAVSLVRFVIQSQETVDREYGGRWSEATEMP
jgi:hypothetical protein